MLPSRILDALQTLAQPVDRVLWAIVVLVVGYLVLGLLVRRRLPDA